MLSKSEQMARVRSRNTDPETALRRALRARGLRYRLEAPLPGSPDIVFVRAKLAVFVDGCFWHGCPMHYTKPVRNADFWDRKLTRNVDRDRKADAELLALGWTVVRIWEHDVADDLPAVVEQLRRLLRLDPSDDV